MRPLTHTMAVDINDTSVSVEFTFTYLAGSPATGPSYSSGGEPATGAEVEIRSAFALIETGMFNLRKTVRLPVPDWMLCILQDDEHVIDALIEAAQEADEDARDYAAEQRADARREEIAA